MVAAEIVTVGNEILLGVVQDTNSNYLCRVVRGMGGRVRHIAIVGDRLEDIAGEIQASLGRQADLIFTCGGLGPTDDDLTLAALANAFGLELQIDQEARDFVASRYRMLAQQGYVSDGEMNEARLKMARLPRGSSMIENPVGTAPAVAVQVKDSRIVCLPGVPAELKAIVEGPLHALLSEVFPCGSYRERELLVQCGDESQLAPALRRVNAAHPQVYIKSRAATFGNNLLFRILISAAGVSAEQAEALIQEASEELTTALRSAGIETSARAS